MPQTLSNLGTPKVDATEETNVTGQMTPILSLSPIDGMKLILRAMVNGKEGIPIYAELKDSSGNDLPLDTDLTLRGDAPHLDQPKVVAHTLSNLRVYRTLSVKEQQNEEYRERTRIQLKEPWNAEDLEIRDIDTLEVAVESSAQIDWANSRLYIDENAVDVVSEG